jgi:hypothetical protein
MFAFKTLQRHLIFLLVVPLTLFLVMYYFCSEGCQDNLLEDLTYTRISYDLLRSPGRPAVLVELAGKGLSYILSGTPPTRASGPEPSKIMKAGAGNLAASTIVIAP